jgi:hypothetical protein
MWWNGNVRNDVSSAVGSPSGDPAVNRRGGLQLGDKCYRSETYFYW